jgi:hypothetical protein
MADGAWVMADLPIIHLASINAPIIPSPITH